MIDNNAEVYSILSDIGTTFFQYPDSFATFPIISYWDSNHTAEDYQDGKNDLDIIETTVDIWEKTDETTGELIKIHVDVDNAMRAHGFKRYLPVISLYETDTHIYHYQGKIS